MNAAYVASVAKSCTSPGRTIHCEKTSGWTHLPKYGPVVVLIQRFGKMHDFRDSAPVWALRAATIVGSSIFTDPPTVGTVEPDPAKPAPPDPPAFGINASPLLRRQYQYSKPAAPMPRMR